MFSASLGMTHVEARAAARQVLQTTGVHQARPTSAAARGRPPEAPRRSYSLPECQHSASLTQAAIAAEASSPRLVSRTRAAAPSAPPSSRTCRGLLRREAWSSSRGRSAHRAWSTDRAARSDEPRQFSPAISSSCRGVVISPPRSRSFAASTSTMRCDPPRANGQPPACAATASMIPSAALSGCPNGAVAMGRRTREQRRRFVSAEEPPERVHGEDAADAGCTDVVQVLAARGGAAGTADRLTRLDDQHRQRRPGQRQRGRQSIRAAADHDGVEVSHLIGSPDGPRPVRRGDGDCARC